MLLAAHAMPRDLMADALASGLAAVLVTEGDPASESLLAGHDPDLDEAAAPGPEVAGRVASGFVMRRGGGGAAEILCTRDDAALGVAVGDVFRRA